MHEELHQSRSPEDHEQKDREAPTGPQATAVIEDVMNRFRQRCLRIKNFTRHAGLAGFQNPLTTKDTKEHKGAPEMEIHLGVFSPQRAQRSTGAEATAPVFEQRVQFGNMKTLANHKHTKKHKGDFRDELLFAVACMIQISSPCSRCNHFKLGDRRCWRD
jgi:hypothetical protein